MEPRARCVMDHCVGNVGDASNLILIQFFRFPPAKTRSLASINIQFLFQTARMTCVRAGGCHYHRHPPPHPYHPPPAHASVTPAGPCSGRTDKCAWTASMVSSHRMMPGDICLMILTSFSECEMADFVTGSSSEKIPFVFLPLAGQLVYPRFVHIHSLRKCLMLATEISPPLSGEITL